MAKAKLTMGKSTWKDVRVTLYAVLLPVCTSEAVYKGLLLWLTEEGTMVMFEASTTGPCKVGGPEDIAAGELTMASGSSYAGSCALDTEENIIVN